MPDIEIDEDVFEVLKNEAEPFVDTTPNSVLRRLLGLEREEPIRAHPQRPAVKERDTGSTASRRSARVRQRVRGRRAPAGSLLAENEYELPILQALVEKGGRAP